MARITRFLENFQDGTQQASSKAFATVAFLEDVYISNTGTVDATVSMHIAIQGGQGALFLKETVIPVGVTLDVLEGRPIRLLNGKGGIGLINWSDSNADIDVTYITS
jgi:hypothetical protein